MEHNLSPSVYKRIVQFQRAELNGSILYEHIAKRQKDERNKSALLEIAQAEREHYEVWKRYTGRDIRPNRLKITFYRALSRILGDC